MSAEERSSSNSSTCATTTWVLEQPTGLVKEKRYADHVEGSVNRKWTYTYTSLGQLSTRTWARGVVTTYGYYDGSTTTPSHSSHRTQELRQISYSDGTPTVSYTYKRSGLPDQITDFTGTRILAYRSNDLQLASETLPSTFYGASRTISPTYEDGSGSTLPNRGNAVEFRTGATVEAAVKLTFDPSTGRITTITGKSGMPTFTYGYTTPGSDWVTTVTSGSYVRTHSLLADRSVLDSVQTNWGATVKGFYDSTFTDARGLRSSVAQSGEVVAASTNTFDYNDRGELRSSDNNTYPAKDYTWNYDFMGKRTSAVNNGSTTTYSAITDAARDVNQYASITGGQAEPDLAYDADGNLTVDGTWAYRYDGENRLRELERNDHSQTLQFKYDYLGRRARKTVRSGGPTAGVASSTKFVWSGWRLLAELDAGTSETGTAVAKSYIWGVDFSNGSGAAGGGGGLLAVNQGGVTYFPVYDATGNVTGYLNSSSGAVAASYEYNPYGQLLAQGGSSTSFAFGFATQYTDSESGLVYYGLRYYSPKHGRFINRDPIEEAGGNNLYGFVGNNPANAWDVLGLWCFSDEYGSPCLGGWAIPWNLDPFYLMRTEWILPDPPTPEYYSGGPTRPAIPANLGWQRDWRKYDPIARARAANRATRDADTSAPLPAAFKQRDVIQVGDGIGQIQVIFYQLRDGKMYIVLLYKNSDGRYSQFNWVQTVRTSDNADPSVPAMTPVNDHDPALARC